MDDKLAVSTPSDTEIMMVREFDAPPALVFAAHSKAEYLERWWGRGNPLDVEIDFRVGGKYRFVERADGEEHPFRGEFLEIVPDERIVYTFEYEPMAHLGPPCVDTLEFTGSGDRTTLRSRTKFETTEQRDGMLQSGMEDGAGQSHHALDALLAELQKA
ncbi:SRPBCC family protein [Sciscionella marina]|uniref:SRPBCC family protein n=1 Tax=Sciscionella marina TaxID=508770 RepID=UPI0003755B1C|nr:SRPBCC family protein [Sciscionella marina]